MKTQVVTIQNKYMVLPVNPHVRKKRVFLFEDKSTLVWDFDAPIDFVNPTHSTYLNVSHLHGKTLTICAEPAMNLAFPFADEIPEGYYHEPYRPMVHFSAKIGWINDPNGMVFDGSRYHLFFQHNPTDSTWGNMTWGHAISTDLVHWSQLDSALIPDEMGTMFSGSGIVDKHNVSGLKENEHDPILLFYTAAGGNSSLSKDQPFTQCMAYSTDGGNTFRKYAHNPVIGHIKGGNRDPKVVWCRELSCYLLALYLDGDEYAIFRSDDLLHFTELQRLHLKGDDECPDFYPLTVANEEGVRKWVFSGASDFYLVGDITDGQFVPCQESTPAFFGHRTGYAAQTFSDAPDHRRIKMAWDILHAPESVFENQMGIPTEISLRKVDGLYRLCTIPVGEFASLRSESKAYTVGRDGLSAELTRDGYDVEITAPIDSPDFDIRFLGYTLRVRPAENKLTYRDVTMPLSFTKEGIAIRLIIDTLGVEIFTDNGLAWSVMSGPSDYNLSEFAVVPLREGELDANVKLHRLGGIW